MIKKRRVAKLPLHIQMAVRRNVQNYKDSYGNVQIDNLIDGICLEFDLFSDNDKDYFNSNGSVKIPDFETNLESFLESIK